MRKFPLKLYNTETTKFLTQQDFSRNLALREKCPNTEFFLSVFSPNVGEYGPEKTPYLDTFHTV